MVRYQFEFLSNRIDVQYKYCVNDLLFWLLLVLFFYFFFSQNKDIWNLDSLEAVTAVGVRTSPHRYPVCKIIDVLEMQKLAFLSHLFTQSYFGSDLSVISIKYIIYFAGIQSLACSFSEGESIFISNRSCKEIRLKH